MSVLTFRYRNTQCYFLPGSDGRLLAVDAGWPGTLREYQQGMKSIGLRFDQLAWALVTHFHMDHAGLVGELQAAGVVCCRFETQGDGIDSMEQLCLRQAPNYRPLDPAQLRFVRVADSAALLASWGIEAQVVPTPGHSDDSISVVTPLGEALVGDLYPPDQVMDTDTVTLASWARLRALGVRRVYPSHAPGFDLA